MTAWRGLSCALRSPPVTSLWPHHTADNHSSRVFSAELLRWREQAEVLLTSITKKAAAWTLTITLRRARHRRQRVPTLSVSWGEAMSLVNHFSLSWCLRLPRTRTTIISSKRLTWRRDNFGSKTYEERLPASKEAKSLPGSPRGAPSASPKPSTCSTFRQMIQSFYKMQWTKSISDALKGLIVHKNVL